MLAQVATTAHSTHVKHLATETLCLLFEARAEAKETDEHSTP